MALDMVMTSPISSAQSRRQGSQPPSQKSDHQLAHIKRSPTESATGDRAAGAWVISQTWLLETVRCYPHETLHHYGYRDRKCKFLDWKFIIVRLFFDMQQLWYCWQWHGHPTTKDASCVSHTYIITDHWFHCDIAPKLWWVYDLCLCRLIMSNLTNQYHFSHHLFVMQY